ncbi:hypothetical protein V8G54_015547 [Vigna mungo]|uniref:Uncharacterized protein n=1 Tax=Vigna mungo TaxID=3915 RepID=A0AAQ3NM71_VIGMU
MHGVTNCFSQMLLPATHFNFRSFSSSSSSLHIFPLQFPKPKLKFLIRCSDTRSPNPPRLCHSANSREAPQPWHRRPVLIFSSRSSLCRRRDLRTASAAPAEAARGAHDRPELGEAGGADADACGAEPVECGDKAADDGGVEDEAEAAGGEGGDHGRDRERDS